MKKLVGEGKPLHSAVDRAAKNLKRKVGTGAEFMKELMGITGIKPTEIQERGLNEVMGMPRMTHDQFMANLSIRPAPAIHEKVLGEQVKDNKLRNQAWEQAYEYSINNLLDIGLSPDQARQEALELADERINRYLPKNVEPEYPTHHGQWTLPGGSNYREMLIKAPQGVDNQEKIMELEAKLRRAPNTNNEEQDQWNKLYNQIRDLKAQQAASPERFEGVSGHFGGEPDILASMRLKDRTGPNGEKLLHLEELQSDWHQEGRKKGYNQKIDKLPEGYIVKKSERYNDYHVIGPDGDVFASGMRPETATANAIDNLRRSGVPDAPFKKNWEEMALKRLIHHAAEKGYHGIVVTPGVEQAKRYSIGNHIGQLNADEYNIAGDRQWRINAKDKSGNKVPISNQYLTDEELASHVGKELANKIIVDRGGEYSGLDLHVGGEGMKGFYDKKVPNILNSIGKKYGVKTELHGHAEKINSGGLQRNPEGGYTEFPPEFHHLHHFPITEDMRKDVLTNGLPLYAQGGTVHMAKGDDMDTMKLEMMRRHMATGGKAKATKGYVTHEPKNPHPEVGTRFKATPQGNLAPMQAFDLMKHEGKGSIVPIPYDATTRDNLVTEVSGNKLINPLLTEAGFDYSLDRSNMAQDIGGASNSAIARRVQDRVDQAAREHKGDVFLAPNIMGEDAENFSHHPAHIVLDLMAQRQLNPTTLQALSDDLRGQFEIKRNAKTGAVTKIYPYTKFVGYHHPKLMEQVTKGGHGLETTAGNLRKKMMERLSLVNMQKLLDYNMGDLKASILDPELATDPKAYMGRTMVKAQPGAALRPSKHTSYDTDYTGINVGGLGPNRPLEILMPDVYEDINAELTARPAKTVKTPAQMRAQVVGALEKRKAKFAQPINARVINNAGLYAEGLSQGEFDPKNVDSVLAYFKRKGGYADGGTVNTKNIGVQEAPNMDIKAYFPPEPVRQGNVLPIGGVEQPQQAPQQPQQSAPAPQGMPQGMPPQGAPEQQSPSNILQMTRQGQAMNAMTPPAQQPQGMARGGTTRRVAYNSDPDAMMLELMQAKRYFNRK